MTKGAVATAHSTERYEILEQIGSGGMGVVYEANDSQAGRRVALKFARGGTNQAACRRLAHEAVAMALPHDRRICSVYDLAQCAGRTCLVMERLVGQTLEARIAGELLSTPEVLDIALQLVVALEAIHRVGLVHQDIKPANVFLTAKGAVKVLDFGLAVTVGGSVAGVEKPRKGSSAVMGTPNYVAPERLLQRPADPRSDSVLARGRDLRDGHRSPAVRGTDPGGRALQCAFSGPGASSVPGAAAAGGARAARQQAVDAQR